MAKPWEKAAGTTAPPTTSSVQPTKPWEKAQEQQQTPATPPVAPTVRKQTGDFFGIPTTQVTNEAGNKNTEFMYSGEKNGMLQNIPVVGGALQSINDFGFQAGVGGGLQAIKSTLSFGEYLLEKVGLNDPDKNYINETFPTLHPNTPLDKTVQDITSMVIGGIGGGALVGNLVKAAKIAPAIAGTIAKFWTKAKVVDPANAVQKLQLFVKSALTEFAGAAGGATITTPQDTKSLSQNMPFGLPSVPSELPGLNKDESQRAGHMIDNVTFSGLFGIITKALGDVGGFVGKAFFGGLKNKTKETEIVTDFMKQLDPGVANVSSEEFAKRAQIMADVLQQNKEAFVNLMGGVKIPVDSVMALRKGITEYVSKAYEFRRAKMRPDEFMDMVNKESQAIITRMIGLKRSRLSSPIVQSSDSVVNEQAGNVVQKQADALASPAEANAVATKAGQNVVDDITGSQINMDVAGTKATVAQDALSQGQSDDAIQKMLEEARANDMLGLDSASKAEINDMTGPQMVQKYKADEEVARQAFKDLPRNIPVDVEAFANKMHSIGDDQHVLDIMGLIPPKKQVGQIAEEVTNDAGETSMSLDSYIERISKLGPNGYLDLGTLYTEIRPLLVKRINSMRNRTGGDVTDVSELEDIKSYIDGLAQASGDPRFSKAMDTYAKFADKWTQTKPLQDFAAAADQVREGRPGLGLAPMNSIDANVAGNNAYKISLEEESGQYLQKFVEALGGGDGGAIDVALAQGLTAKAISGLIATVKSGDMATASQIAFAIRPYAEQLKKLDPTSYNQWLQTVDHLTALEQGANDATAFFEQATKAHQDMLDAAGTNAASHFVEDLTKGSIHVTSNPQAAFKQIFEHKDAPNLIRMLFKKIDTADNPLAKEGVQSQFLRYLQDKVFGNTQMAVAEGGAKNITDVSPARLQSILGGFGDNTLKVMDEVFANSPDTSQGIKELLTLLKENVNTRGVRVQNFSSATAVDNELQQNVRLMTRVVFGVLNRTATTIGAISGAVTAGTKASMEKTIFEILDKTITNPDFFAKALKAIAADKTGNTFEAIWKNYLGSATRETTRAVLNERQPSMTPQMVEPAPKPPDPNMPQQMNGAFGAEAASVKKPMQITVVGGNPNLKE